MGLRAGSFVRYRPVPFSERLGSSACYCRVAAYMTSSPMGGQLQETKVFYRSTPQSPRPKRSLTFVTSQILDGLGHHPQVLHQLCRVPLALQSLFLEFAARLHRHAGDPAAPAAARSRWAAGCGRSRWATVHASILSPLFLAAVTALMLDRAGSVRSRPRYAGSAAPILIGKYFAGVLPSAPTHCGQYGAIQMKSPAVPGYQPPLPKSRLTT